MLRAEPISFAETPMELAGANCLGAADARDDRNRRVGQHPGGVRAGSSIAADGYVHHYYQAYEDHNWPEGRDNSAWDEGSAGSASGGYRASAVQGRIDVCKDIFNGFGKTT